MTLRIARLSGVAVIAMILASGVLGVVRADDEALRSRIATLEGPAERADATELLDQARRALLTSDRLRVSGDDDGAARAERIAAARTAASAIRSAREAPSSSPDTRSRSLVSSARRA